MTLNADLTNFDAICEQGFALFLDPQVPIEIILTHLLEIGHFQKAFSLVLDLQKVLLNFFNPPNDRKIIL